MIVEVETMVQLGGVVASGGGLVAWVRFKLRGHDERITRLEIESMSEKACEQKHGGCSNFQAAELAHGSRQFEEIKNKIDKIYDFLLEGRRDG